MSLSDKFKNLKEQKTKKLDVVDTPKPKKVVSVKREKKKAITIRKLMAVREMFELPQPKQVNKKSLAKLIVRALEPIFKQFPHEKLKGAEQK